MPAERRDLAAHEVFIKKGGRGEMIKAPISLQDLRQGLYVKAKTERAGRTNVPVSTGSGGAGNGCMARWDQGIASRQPSHSAVAPV